MLTFFGMKIENEEDEELPNSSLSAEITTCIDILVQQTTMAGKLSVVVVVVVEEEEEEQQQQQQQQHLHLQRSAWHRGCSHSCYG